MGSPSKSETVSRSSCFSMARQVELQTSIGSFVVELYDNHAPKTCKNFLELARRGYYNETPVSK